MTPIQNLAVYNDGVPMDGSAIEKYPPGEPMNLHANVSSGWPVNYTFYTIYKDREINRKDSSEYTFNPDKGGRWKIVVNASNRLSYENFTVEVDVINSCESTIKIYDRREKENPFRTNLANDIRFNTEEIFYNKNSKNCSSLEYNCWTFNWTLHYENDRQERDFPVQHKKFFFSKKGVIKPGSYKAKLYAMCNKTNRTSAEIEEETYFKVEPLDPIAIISGKDL